MVSKWKHFAMEGIGTDYDWVLGVGGLREISEVGLFGWVYTELN